jgi:hypothetical protein
MIDKGDVLLQTCVDIQKDTDECRLVMIQIKT